MKTTRIKNGILSLFINLIAVIGINAQVITAPVGVPIQIGNEVNVTGGGLNIKSGTDFKIGGIKVLSNAGSNNIFVGENTGTAIGIGTANAFIGLNAGKSTTTGGSNVFIGVNAGFSNVGGNSNLFIGSNSGFTNAGGNFNTFLGPSSGVSNTSGSSNMFLGYQAGYSNTLGADNVYLGYNAGSANITGGTNIFIGSNSGVGNISGSSNTYIGVGANGTAALTNATAIGANANATASNSLVLGNGANVGIGITAPTDKLHVVGSVRFQGLPTDAPGGTAVQYLVADATGKVYVYTGTAPARIGAPEGTGATIPGSFSENWTLKNDFLYNKNKKGIIIGEGISSLPKGYGMYVTDGILTEKVKVAIKNSSDWADYVFNKDYKKMSLTEVEKFISKNKHLPNIPSAAQMVSEGNDLAKTDAKLLEKIEELTLYMIEMKKENAQMKRQINTLKRKIK